MFPGASTFRSSHIFRRRRGGFGRHAGFAGLFSPLCEIQRR